MPWETRKYWVSNKQESPVKRRQGLLAKCHTIESSDTLSSFDPFHQPRGLLGWPWDPLHKDKRGSTEHPSLSHTTLGLFLSTKYNAPMGILFSFKWLIPWITKLISSKGLKGETKQRCLAFKNLIYEILESSWVLLYSGLLPIPPKVLRGRTEHTKHLKANTMRYLFYPVRVKAIIVGCRSQQSHMQYPQ